MAAHLDTGRLGEQLAATYLVKQGFAILHRNWRYRHCEIDFVTVKNQVLHFVEVKTRRTARYGWPEAGVTYKKLSRMIRAGNAFVQEFDYRIDVQFDVLSVLLIPRQPAAFLLIEDVYI